MKGGKPSWLLRRWTPFSTSTSRPSGQRTFTDERQERVRRYYGENFVVDESIVHGSANGAPNGIPGENKPVSFRLLHICEFRDGRMVRENVWPDILCAIRAARTRSCGAGRPWRAPSSTWADAWRASSRSP
ncbi:ester cyclase [Streptomyces sp. UNOC14_S4]|uniref:ester cyclase n=1 Tax=Streptomyces sp. UNOC14_S4 TaxID=2872340 RepID=UPI001E3DDF64|nr:ester cyclase [Streptomyces sp. UNOC14_S4]MCC3766913.1 ester cyclase [Streptomyces sp. UNOC14_S4]